MTPAVPMPSGSFLRASTTWAATPSVLRYVMVPSGAITGSTDVTRVMPYLDFRKRAISHCAYTGTSLRARTRATVSASSSLTGPGSYMTFVGSPP